MCERGEAETECWCVVPYGPQGHSDWVSSVAYNPDGRQLLSGSGDEIVRVWDLGIGLCSATLEVSLPHIQGAPCMATGRVCQ